MFRFSIFGVPVEVQPFFWVTSALLGGAIYADSREDFLRVALFMLASFISVLIHELGHALTGRKLGGGYASILLYAMGGLAFNRGGVFNRGQRFWMVAAGPGAGFAFFLAILAVMGLFFHSQDVIAYVGWQLFGLDIPFKTDKLIDFFQAKPFIRMFISNLLWINFWWGIINLLPIMPLDGGLITDLYVKPQRRVFLIGMVAAAAVAVIGLVKLDSVYMAVLFGYFAWQNYQNMKSVSWQ